MTKFSLPFRKDPNLTVHIHSRLCALCLKVKNKTNMRTEVIQQKPKRASNTSNRFTEAKQDNSLMISSEERARLSMKSVILPVNPSTVQRRLRTNFEGKRKMNSNAVKFSLDLGTIQGIDEGEFNDGQKKWRLADQRRYVFASIRTLSLSLLFIALM